ncbi:MAG: hydrogenase, partial [Gammaproteobacteria bacterium]|nr:hydrogenase [Gammaproteobacteria bacterium]
DPESAKPFMTDEEMRNYMRHNLLNALEAANWRVSGENGAAKLLGLKPTTLTDRMRAMDIERPPRNRKK